MAHHCGDTQVLVIFRHGNSGMDAGSKPKNRLSRWIRVMGISLDTGHGQHTKKKASLIDLPEEGWSLRSCIMHCVPDTKANVCRSLTVLHCVHDSAVIREQIEVSADVLFLDAQLDPHLQVQGSCLK